MFGYVQPFIPELRVMDKELYQAYYCGLCRALGKYGLSSRLTLTYDAAFAAILLAGVTGDEPDFARRACAAHPGRGRFPVVVTDEVVDYAAALCLMFAKYKLLDDARDGRPLRKAAVPALNRGVKKAEAKFPAAAEALKKGLDRIEEIEKAEECDPDSAPMVFGELLGDVLAAYPAVSEEALPLVQELGRKLGGFIYTADAWDDREDDKKRGSYNIFLRAKFEEPKETCAAMLDMYINSAVLAYDLMDIKYNKPLLDNIMYKGLCVRAAEVLHDKDENKDGKEEAK